MKINTIESSSFVLIEPQDDEHYRLFQRVFYDAFCDLPGRVLLDQIWHIDDTNKRIDLRLNRSEIDMLLWMTNGKVLGAAAGCQDGNQSFSQVRHYGFKNPAPQLKTFEVYCIFRNPELPASQRIQSGFLEAKCFPHLREEGYQLIIATCSDFMWPVYQRWGWELLQVNTISGFKRYFISKLL